MSQTPDITVTDEQFVLEDPRTGEEIPFTSEAELENHLEAQEAEVQAVESGA